MPQKCETRAGKARASRNCLVGSFRDHFISHAFNPQAIPSLIALHIGYDFLAHQHDGGGND